MRICDTKLNKSIKSVYENLNTSKLPQDESVKEILLVVGQFFKDTLT
jgi:hypothetical protein